MLLPFYSCGSFAVYASHSSAEIIIKRTRRIILNDGPPRAVARQSPETAHERLAVRWVIRHIENKRIVNPQRLP